ncbi:MAG: radical SAM family heme chaperone HemW [Fibrobacter sp.]|nr:radical SAM family heme chaperone HemW [Fibrobacter sp.]
MFSIYLHIPFCKKVCDYCDFRVLSAPERLFTEYTELLCKEITCYEEIHPGLLKTAKTLYLGGGTPSLLRPDCLAQIFESLQKVGVDVHNLQEVSMEFNPESVTETSVKNAMSLGVNRISVGLQTFNDRLLQLIGRVHSSTSGLRALEYLTNIPGLEVSGDLMFNLPTQSLDDFVCDIDKLSSFALNHVSFYGLTLSPRTVLGKRVAKGIISVDEDLYEPMYLAGVELLSKKGFERYEVSNFARPGHQSVHNKNYWECGEYAGFGPGAHSYLGGVRSYAPEIYPRWREYVQQGCNPDAKTYDCLTVQSQIAEMIWLSLRQSSGLDVKKLKTLGWMPKAEVIAKWAGQGYLHVQGDVFNPESDAKLTLVGRGWVFMDDIVTDLM